MGQFLAARVWRHGLCFEGGSLSQETIVVYDKSWGADLQKTWPGERSASGVGWVQGAQAGREGGWWDGGMDD